jgi:hypothetical protein
MRGRRMGKKLLFLGAILAAAVVAGLGASAASAGESTGNCHQATNDKAADNCKGPDPRVSEGNSVCSFSGQNDVPAGSSTEGIGGVSQSYGQDVKAGSAFPGGVVPIDPSTQNPGKTDDPSPHPGYACNPNNPPLGG